MFTINLNVLVTMFLKCELLHVFELFFHLCHCTSKVTTENLHSWILILVKKKTAFGVSNVDTVVSIAQRTGKDHKIWAYRKLACKL